MIYVLHLFEADAAKCAAFTSAFDQGGFWLKIASTIPGHLFTHLLKQQGKPNIFLAIEFWVSEAHFARARDSVQVQALDRWIGSATIAHFNLGIFQFRGLDINPSYLPAGAAAGDSFDKEHA